MDVLNTNTYLNAPTNYNIMRGRIQQEVSQLRVIADNASVSVEGHKGDIVEALIPHFPDIRDEVDAAVAAKEAKQSRTRERVEASYAVAGEYKVKATEEIGRPPSTNSAPTEHEEAGDKRATDLPLALNMFSFQ